MSNNLPLSIYTQGLKLPLHLRDDETAPPKKDETPKKPVPFDSEEAKQKHQDVYNNFTKNTAMVKMLREQITHQKQNEKIDIEQHEKAKKKLGSAGLLTSTAGTLFAEAALHFSNSTNRAPTRSGIGAMQIKIGMAGYLYYGSKVGGGSEPTWMNAFMALGYEIFCAEGFFRTYEAQNPSMPKTGIAGMSAALTKSTAASTPLCTLSYTADSVANAIETLHGTEPPKESVFARALWNLGHSFKSRQVAAIQIGAALAMLADAGGKIHKYVSTKPEGYTVKDKKVPGYTGLDEKLDNFFVKLAAGDKDLEKKLEEACNAPSAEQCEKAFLMLVDAYAGKEPLADVAH